MNIKYQTLLDKLKNVLRMQKASTIELLTVQEEANTLLEDDTLIDFKYDEHLIQVGEYPDAVGINNSISDIESTTNYLFSEANKLVFQDPSDIISGYYARLIDIQTVLFKTMPELYIDTDNPLYIGYNLLVSNTDNLTGGMYLYNGTLTNMVSVNNIPSVSYTASLNSSTYQTRITGLGHILTTSPYLHKKEDLKTDGGMELEIYNSYTELLTKDGGLLDTYGFNGYNLADTPSDNRNYYINLSFNFATDINYTIFIFKQIVEDLMVANLTKNEHYIIEYNTDRNETILTIFDNNVADKTKINLIIRNHNDLSEMSSFYMRAESVTSINVITGEENTVITLVDQSGLNVDVVSTGSEGEI